MSSLRVITKLVPLFQIALSYGPIWASDLPSISEPGVVHFFREHCVACHRLDAADSAFRIDESLTEDFRDPAIRARWGEIVDVLNSHQMPPEDEPQPDAAGVAVVVDWITAQIVEAEREQRENRVVMRRLNRVEYRNTIQELTSLDIDISHFPEDPSAGGFDNIGSALTFSPMQMELYLETAERIMEEAIVEHPKPTKILWHFEVESGDSDRNRIEIDGGQRPIVNGGRNPVDNGFKILHHESWDKKITVRDFAVKDSGEYLIRIRAAGHTPRRDEVVTAAGKILEERLAELISKQPAREQAHREQMLRDLSHFENDPIYSYGPPRMKVILTLDGQPETIAELDVEGTRELPQVIEIPVTMTTQRAGVTIEYAYSIPKVLENFWMQGRDVFERPELLVDWIELEGPVFEMWPPRSHQKLIPISITEINEESEAGNVIRSFVEAAFRRPITELDVAPYLDFYKSSRHKGETPYASLRTALAAVLVSPHFLYLVETGEDTGDGNHRVTAYQLASRLSYFLWSGPPDAELLATAYDSSLLDVSVLSSQVQRMLKSPRSEQFVMNFADQWLGLRGVGANPPAEDLFPHYDRHLELSMIEEGRALVRTMLREQRDLFELIDPDYLVINQRLARFYGIPNITGDYFRKVLVGKESPRAGILTQAAMLSVTSNGTRTSPVKRGTWILTNVLGNDPGLPVANAGDIAPKVPGVDKATVRQRLEIHRELPQCARCHDKIDPLGLALENFNAAGQFRYQEGFGYKGRIQRDDPVINASAKLPDGTPVNGPVDLRRAIRKQESQFIRCLAEKLLTYALGRELTFADAPSVFAIVRETEERGKRLDAMIEAVVSSEAFQSF